MAAAPLNSSSPSTPSLNTPTQTDPALQGLIDSLAANTPPSAPSAWPPPPVVWLLGIVLLVVIGMAVFYFLRTRNRRAYLKALKKVRQTGGARQSILLHNLLRNAAAHRNPTNASLSDDDFARLICDTMNQSQAPAWVNAHYRPEPQAKPDWQQASQLIRRWCR